MSMITEPRKRVAQHTSHNYSFGVKYAIVDVFTRTPLTGNPVAVFLDASSMSGERMQRVAREMNLSETTFVLPPRQGGDVRVRIFTPVNELPFAGHPTLGTAIVLAESLPGEHLLMETEMGIISFDLTRSNGTAVSARMQQPIPDWKAFDRTDELLTALGLHSSTLPVEMYCNGPRHVFVGLPDVAGLSRVSPDLRALARFTNMATNCFTRDGAHWRMRMFSPAYGVTEDAATGSAASPLALHLARHGVVPFGREIRIMQGVEMGRASEMYAKVEGTPDRVDSAEASGAAVVVGRGALCI